jgi:hypothetical protein
LRAAARLGYTPPRGWQHVVDLTHNYPSRTKDIVVFGAIFVADT